MGLPVGCLAATSKQNDLWRISNEYAVDRAGRFDSSTRTVTSGSARQSARTRSLMSRGSQRLCMRGRAGAPLTNHCRSLAASAPYQRTAARTATAAELYQPRCPMQSHSLLAAAVWGFARVAGGAGRVCMAVGSWTREAYDGENRCR